MESYMPPSQVTVRLSANMLARLDQYVEANPAMSRSAVVGEALDSFLPSSGPSGVSRALPGAGQDAETGRAGRDFGVTAGRTIARKLGELVDPVATELRLPDGRKATVRTAKNRNVQWGCLHSVRDRVDCIICAYTKDERTFEVWEVTPAQWRSIAREASPGHKLYGRLTLVRKSDVERVGKPRSGIVLEA
jgi:hypothetical protein